MDSGLGCKQNKRLEIGTALANSQVFLFFIIIIFLALFKIVH